MIQVYSPDNTEFTNNGDMTLMPTSCSINAELNGAWEAEIRHPVDKDGRWKFIESGAVLKIPSFLESDQLFRIYNTQKSDSEIIANARPVFMDAVNDCMWAGVVFFENSNGQEALEKILESNPKYSGSSNIQKIATANYVASNAIESINGESSDSFVNLYEGEIVYDNFEIIINDRVGGDYGVELLYGKNIEVDGFSETVDYSNVVTRIYPYSYNGFTMASPFYVDSDNAGQYPIIYGKHYTYENIKLYTDANEDDYNDENIIVCNSITEIQQVLKDTAEKEFLTGIDKPSVTIEANMVLLKNTEQYKDYAMLEDVSLGDTIHCRHSKLGVVTNARVISLEYDCILKKVNSVELGDFAYNYFNNVSSSVNRVDSAIRPDGSIVAQQIKGIVDGMKASLRVQKSVAEKQDVRAILFEDLDPNSTTYGAMCLGTQGFQIANERTSDDRDWDWRTFGTAEGFSADLITAGTLAAINIIGSVITGGTISGTTISGSTIKGNTISGGTISGTTISGSTITSVGGGSELNISGGKIDAVSTQAGTGGRFRSEYDNQFAEVSAISVNISTNDIDNYARMYPGRILVVKNGNKVFDTDNL